MTRLVLNLPYMELSARKAFKFTLDGYHAYFEARKRYVQEQKEKRQAVRVEFNDKMKDFMKNKFDQKLNGKDKRRLNRLILSGAS